MTREQARELLPVIQAYAEGKIVQAKLVNVERDTWDDQATPYFESDNLAYRVKPEPREFWINLHDYKPSHCYGAYSTKAEADLGVHRKECIHVREVLP